MIAKIFLLIVAAGFGYFLLAGQSMNKTAMRIRNMPAVKDVNRSQADDYPETSIVAEGLDTPWSLVFLPDDSILVAERPGRVRFIGADGKMDTKPITLKQVAEVGEGGLLGMTLHPNFASNRFIYFYYTYHETKGNTLNRVVRMKYENRQLTDEKIIIDNIPGQSNHNGGRIKFGPDKNLYITTGDAQQPELAQDKTSLNGKILRVTDEGKKPVGNPFDNLVYSFGHRNSQGLVWDENGELYATEHGRSGIMSGLDEFNRIEPGKNYGWPVIEGDETRDGMSTPQLNSGPSETWAPAGLAFYKGAFYFGGLRGSALYQVVFTGGKPRIAEYFKNEFGRIRDVEIGPDNMLYITTSNKDGRGTLRTGDDKIIRINPEKLRIW